jgi:hypothetical protein
MKPVTLKLIRKTEFLTLYNKLILREKLNDKEVEALLKIAVIFINSGDENIQELGYRMIVLYSNFFAEYEPLYDIALYKGYIPISKIIEKDAELSHYFEETFFNALLSSFGETFKRNDIYLTTQQTELASHFDENVDKGISVVAPTSYGKSELFVNFCAHHENANVVIIVPTKALLAQIKRRVLHRRKAKSKKRKIITHPEMYNNGDANFIAILTQERLLRMMQNNHELKFDYAFIDEAHNLLSGDSRNLLLAQVIAILNSRNKKVSFCYLSPFIFNSKNLYTKYTKNRFSEFKISEHLKTERYYLLDLRENGDKVLKFYDQYLDELIDIPNDTCTNVIQFMQKHSGTKNIVYLNSPPKLEKFAIALSKKLASVNNSELLSSCEDISEILHKDYELIDCLKSGVVYHHGSVPDVVRLFVEYLYSTISEIKYVVTSSTLLEGVNIPAEKLFLLECKKGKRNLSPSQFKNLVGRICRFSELFDNNSGSLTLLEPEIYVIASNYMSHNTNIEIFIRDRVKVDSKMDDILENVLLEGTPITDDNQKDLDKANETLENIEPGITGNVSGYAATEFGKYCYNNNISEINILEHEKEISKYLKEICKGENKIADVSELMNIIHHCFIEYIPEDEHKKLQRLSQSSAKKFYAMFIKWRMRNASYGEMIKRFLDYWNEIDDPLVYVDKWGDTARSGYHMARWVDISEKTDKQKVNLAIVRIKEEQDFFDNNVMKFIETLNDMELLDYDFYTKIKYGTTDERKITMLKNGFSAGLATLLLEKYSKYLDINIQANTVDLKEAAIKSMRDNQENRLHIFEAGFFTC